MFKRVQTYLGTKASSPRWAATFWFAVIVGIAVWGKGWERGLLIASTLVAAIAQGLMSVDIISSVKVQRRLGLRQWFFVAVLAAVAIFFPFTEWWRLYVVTLGGAFAIILIYLVG